MPRYLALDYLSKAVGDRRCQLEGMLITTPRHMEIVDSYIHQGQLPASSLLWQPWKNNQPPVDVVISCSTETMGKEMAILVNCYSHHCNGGGKLEMFNTSSDFDDVGSEVDLFSQDIARAMGELGTGEDYPVETLGNWDLILPQDSIGVCLIECPESPNTTDTLLSLLPRVEDLARRLKPKLLQDPFLDQQGQAFCYERLTRSDLSLDHFEPDDLSVHSEPGDPPVHSEPDDPLVVVSLSSIRERFSPESLPESVDTTDLDPLFALPLPNEGEPLLLQANEVELLLMEELVDNEEMKDDSKDLLLLMEEMSKKSLTKLPSEVVPDLSPVTEARSKVLDFSTFNNQDVSIDFDDSGIGHALLESPLLPHRPHPLSPLINKQLARLEPIPTSPDREIVFLSPGTELRLSREVWEREAVFDTILAHRISCPDTGGGVVERGLEVSAVSELISLLEVTEVKMSGDSELELDWDPLFQSYHLMELAEKSLISRHPHSPHSPHTLTPHTCPQEREEFSKHVLNEEVAIEIPLSLSTAQDSGWRNLDVLESQSMDSRVIEETRLSQPLASVHPKDAAWNLLLQSASTRTREPSNQITRSNNPPANTVSRRMSDDVTRSTSNGIARKSVPSVMDKCDGLEAFLMLRSKMTMSTGVKRSLNEETEGAPHRKKIVEALGDDSLMELELIERTATSAFLDVCLSGSYLSTVTKLDGSMRDLRGELTRGGLQVPTSGGSLDSLKFVLKQQQKALQDNTNPSKTDYYVRSCQLTATLYLTASVYNALVHCSLGVALAKVTSLCDKYQHVLRDGAGAVKRELLELPLVCQTTHPKLLELVRLLSGWRREGDRGDKAVIVVETEFPTLSVEILDILQSVPDMKACVFSMLPESSQLYQRTVEEVFQTHHCLVVPVASLCGGESFPWERVRLLVEYEELTRPLFDTSAHRKGDRGPTIADRLNLKKYVTLRTVGDLSSNLHLTEGGCEELSSVQYTLIASERIVTHTQLLQLLETRYNTVIVERDYSPLRQHHRQHSYADLLVDPSTGLLLRPLSSLASEAGVRATINTLTALSFQLTTCWLLLYTEDSNSYAYGGAIPSNLARVHASVAHYCPKLDAYSVRIITTPSTDQLAAWVRRVAEKTHLNNTVQDSREWVDRDWIDPEMTKQEMVLISFPCLNSFSAQCLLRVVCLGDLIRMSLEQLQYQFPWLSHKVAKMFHKMCNSNEIAEIVEPDSAFLPSMEAATDDDDVVQVNSSYYPPQTEVEHFERNTPLLNHQGDNDTRQFSHDLAFMDCVANDERSLPPQGSDTVVLNDSLEEVEMATCDNNDKISIFGVPNHESYTINRTFLKQDNSSQNSEVIDLTSPDIKLEHDSMRHNQSIVEPGYHFDFSFSEGDHNTSIHSEETGLFSDYFKQEAPKPPHSRPPVTAANQSSAVRLLSSSRQMPSQKQIKKSVLSSIFKPSTYRGGPSTSSYNSQLGYVSSSIVTNKASSQLRTPVKSLDLGFREQNRSKVLLQCNDRTIGSNVERQAETRATNRIQDGTTLSLFGTEPSRSFVRHDSLVPSSHTTISPQYKNTSLFDSPRGSVKLSPAKKKLQLTCQRDPTRTDGQTKLVLF